MECPMETAAIYRSSLRSMRYDINVRSATTADLCCDSHAFVDRRECIPDAEALRAIFDSHVSCSSTRSA